MRLRIFYPIAFLLLITSSGFAQHADPMEAMSGRASRLIDSVMAKLNIRSERFNEEMDKVNKAKAIDPVSLDSVKLQKNTVVLKDFLQYLDVYRSLSGHTKKEVEDSIQAMRLEMPRRYKQTYLQEFLDAFQKDQSAFDKYTLALTKLFTSVSEVLQFISTTHVKVVDNKIQFTDKKQYDHYQKMMDEVNEHNKKVISASAASQKATLEASKAMQEAYGQSEKNH
jgi:hypothetical protein